MAPVPLLAKSPALRTRSAEELQDWLRPNFAVRAIDMPDRGRRFDSVVNHRALSSLSLTYAAYGSPITAHMTQNDCFVQGFPVFGRGAARWDRHSVIVEQQNGGIAFGPGAEFTFDYGADFAHLVLKITPGALARKLTALIGKPVDPPIEIVAQRNSDPQLRAAQVRLLRFLAEELDRQDDRLPAGAFAELEDAVLVTFLMANESNYSKWLNGTPRAAAPWQVRRAVDYIEQYWDQPITVETLAGAAQTTARSLFYLFRRTHGVSPMVYVQRVRLRHARAMLSNPTPATSVTSVGFACGFSNLGHFAHKYFQAFGEKPSDTLRSHL